MIPVISQKQKGLLAVLFATVFFIPFDIFGGEGYIPLKEIAPKKLSVIQNKDVIEVSGLCRSLVEPGTLWSHNDSGGRSELFRTSLHDNKATTITIKTDISKAIDWEDICSFQYYGKPAIVIADTGNNPGKRYIHTLSIFLEPQETNPEKFKELKEERKIKFMFDKPKRDCESIVYADQENLFYLITKTYLKPCKVFTLDPNGNDDILQAKSVAVLPHTMITGMDISSDGKYLALISYSSVIVYPKGNAINWIEAFIRKPFVINLKKLLQYESICFSADGKKLYITHEGRNPDLLFFDFNEIKKRIAESLSNASQ